MKRTPGGFLLWRRLCLSARRDVHGHEHRRLGAPGRCARRSSTRRPPRSPTRSPSTSRARGSTRSRPLLAAADHRQPVTIDGYTQPGSSPNTNATGALNTVCRSRSTAPRAPIAASRSAPTTRRFGDSSINRCAEGIELFNSVRRERDRHRRRGQFHRHGPEPASPRCPTDRHRHRFTQGGTVSATVGGPDPADRNLISGNTNAAIFVGSNFNGGSTSASTATSSASTRTRDAAPQRIGNLHRRVWGPRRRRSATSLRRLGNIIAGNSGAGINAAAASSSATIRGQLHLRQRRQGHRA